MTAPGTIKHDSAMSVLRKWAGLTPGQWHWAHDNGHNQRPGQDPASLKLVMNDGFCCECCNWRVPHSGGPVSNVRAGYEAWGAHVRALPDCPAPGQRRRPTKTPPTATADPEPPSAV